MAELRFPVEIDDSKALKELTKLDTKIGKLKQNIAKSEATRAPIVKQLKEAQTAADEASKKVEELKAALASEKGKVEFAQSNGGMKASEWTKAQSIQKQISTELSTQEQILQKQSAEVDKLQAKDDKIRITLEGQTAELQDAQAAAGELTRQISEAKDVAKLKNAFEGVKTSLTKSMKSILRYGFGIRSLYILFRRLKQYTIEAVSAFAENDPETKAKISELKTALAGLKGSWGAAFAPIVTAVIPVLKTLVSWLTTAANAIAAFFAALAGKGSYKKAVASTGELSSNLGGAADNAKEAKKELMGIDELNVMSDSDTGGGGGGGSGSTPGYEYEEIPISDGLKENLELIKDLVLGIGAGILGWKIASSFTSSLKTIIGVALMFAGIAVGIKGALSAWNDGVDWQNLKEMIAGVGIAAIGAALAFGAIGAGITLLVGGLAMLVVGIRDWIVSGELSHETCLLIVAGILAIGAGIALLTGSWIPLVIAAVAAIAMAIYGYWDEISAWISEHVIEPVKQAWADLKEYVVTKVTELLEKAAALWEQIKTTVTGKVLALYQGVLMYWTALKSAIVYLWDSIKTAVTTKVDDFKNNIVGKFEALKTKLSNIVEKIKSLFNFDFRMPTLKLPHIQVQWQEAGALAQFFGIKALPHLSVAWYAKGGIVDGATLIGAGEQGKEAIVPLERNTQWVTMVARELADMLFDRDIFTEIADRISGIPTALDRMTAQLANIGNIPMPAVAMGTVVPPNATSGGYAYSALESKIDALLDKLNNGGGGGKIEPSDIYLDKRKVGEVTYEYIQERERGRGK